MDDANQRLKPTLDYSTLPIEPPPGDPPPVWVMLVGWLIMVTSIVLLVVSLLVPHFP